MKHGNNPRHRSRRKTITKATDLMCKGLILLTLRLSWTLTFLLFFPILLYGIRGVFCDRLKCFDGLCQVTSVGAELLQPYGATTFSPFFLLGSYTKKTIGFSHNPGFRPKFLVHCPFRPCHKYSQDLPCGVSVSIQYHRVFVYIKRLKVRFFDSQRY